MVASRIVELPEDLLEETDVRCLAGVRGDLPLLDTDQRDGMVFAGDRWWYFSLPLAFWFDFAVDLC
ncbi:BnaC03g48250D [Brassica napus]|uniref:BnaC03g48250D protein n=1 Tax=Brassica napus TaxID=3708 RepID=A0A078F3Y1_BRANA|nr:BnaC03g48250D [Brassica napus]